MKVKNVENEIKKLMKKYQSSEEVSMALRELSNRLFLPIKPLKSKPEEISRPIRYFRMIRVRTEC